MSFTSGFWPRLFGLINTQNRALRAPTHIEALPTPPKNKTKILYCISSRVVGSSTSVEASQEKIGYHWTIEADRQEFHEVVNGGKIPVGGTNPPNQ